MSEQDTETYDGEEGETTETAEDEGENQEESVRIQQCILKK